MTPTRRPATEAEVAALASPVRLRIIRLTHTEALTNADIAGRLGRDPATTLHHVRRLAKHGFLQALPARRGNRGAKEIPYRSTGLSWALDPGDARGELEEALLEAFLGEVADVGSESLRQTRLVLHLDPAAAAELTQDLQTLLDGYAARPPDPGGKGVALYLAIYPTKG